MQFNYHNRQFRVVSNSTNGEVSSELIFTYHQKGNILVCHYSDHFILEGHLLGIVHPDGTIQSAYHQINRNNELKTGTCVATPELMPNGKIRLQEQWKWTSGDHSRGTSVLKEL